MRHLGAAALALAVFTLSGAASANTTTPTKEERDKPEARDDGKLDIGVLGGVGFPRPLAIEGVVGVRRMVMLGAEYSFLPKMSLGPVDARLWALAADLRFFPFKGAFYIGLRSGYQSFAAGATLSAARIGSYSESIEVGTWFINPRIGFLWRVDPFAIGVDAGVQIPFETSVSRSRSISRPTTEFDDRLTSTADTLGRTVLPTIDLLRVGLVF